MSGIDLADAHWFAMDLDIPRGNVHVVQVDESLIEDSVFVDVRMPVDTNAMRVVGLPQVAAAGLAGAPAGWLWHTSFCGSTLLARMLYLPPHSVCLREPLMLRRLSDAHEAGTDIAPFVRPVIDLLSRPWRPGGKVVIKPTHAALNIAVPIMCADAGSRGLVLTSSLDDFLVSHLKKSPETLSRIGLLAQRALRAGTLAQRLPRAAFAPPDALCAAALQWAAQRDLVMALKQAAGARVQVIEWDRVQSDLPGLACNAAQWLQLDLPEQVLREHAAQVAGIHAKAPGVPYDVDSRNLEIAGLRSRHGDALSAARRWADAHVLPFLPADALVA